VKRALFGLTLVALAACGIDALGLKVEDDDGGDGGGADGSPSGSDSSAADAAEASSEVDAGADATVDAMEAGCPTGMVTIPDAGYCIDGIEVTEAKWNAFLAADAGTAMLPAACAFKTAYGAGSVRDAGLPVSNVDWCDAFGYCASLGKRLCAATEWTTACNGGTARTFPYGNVFDDQKCNGGPLGVPAVPGTFAQCVGPIPGIFDMSGNMDEWDVTCATALGAADLCQTRGGDWQNDGEGELMCTSIQQRARNSVLGQVGFRCCK
jgi:formylglycine-generating enzyme